mgnify:CR=1 FL=1
MRAAWMTRWVGVVTAVVAGVAVKPTTTASDMKFTRLPMRAKASTTMAATMGPT